MWYHLLRYCLKHTTIKMENSKFPWNVEQSEPRSPVCGNVSSAAVTEGMAALRKFKYRTTIGSSYLLLGVYPKESRTPKKHLHSHVHYSIVLRNRQEVEITPCPQRHGQRSCYIHVESVQSSERRESCHVLPCGWSLRTWRYSAKWNKLITEKYLS